MLDLTIVVVDEDADTAAMIARQFARDAGQIAGIDAAALLREPAPAGSKGLTEIAGAIFATLATAGAIGPLIDLAKSFMVRRSGRILVFRAKDFEISIPADEMSDERFDGLVDQLLARLPKGDRGETA